MISKPTCKSLPHIIRRLADSSFRLTLYDRQGWKLLSSVESTNCAILWMFYTPIDLASASKAMLKLVFHLVMTIKEERARKNALKKVN